MRAESIGVITSIAFTVVSLAGVTPTQAQCNAWTQRSPAAHPPAGLCRMMAYDSNRGVTVAFRAVNGAPNNETWEWDGANWTQRNPTNAPLPLNVSDMVYDSARHVCVIFGGSAFDPNTGQFDSDQTWEYDGTNWTQRSPAHSPPGRYLHALAYDNSRHVTVLFGGFQSSGSGGCSCNLGDTWEYDGTDWTQKTPANSPDARDGHAMTFDTARGVTVLFAGQTFVTSSDTWEWDGANWTQRTPAHHPVERRDHVIAFDSDRGVTILFGGELTSPLRPAGDTWKWDGNDWTEISPAASPPSRDGASMAYDSTRHLMVLFGGNHMGDIADTWELSGVVIDPQPLPANRFPGQTANFFIASTGTNLSYQWQVSTDGGATFNNVTTGTGGTTVSYTTPVLAVTDNGNKYRCVVSDGCGSTTSNSATLTVQNQSQPNTVTLPDFNGDSITIVSPTGTTLGNVAVLGNPSPSDTPAGATFPVGFLNFSVSGLAAGGSTSVQITLPSGVTANDYWKYGPTPDNTAPHWYEFLFDGKTGAQFNGNVITLNFVDGDRGDDDLTADGVITDPGAPALQSTPGALPTTGSCGLCGGGAAAMMPFILLCWAVVRNRIRPSSRRSSV